jgi:N-acetylmuramic acid 6-phosphate (MurNAc-6-P) etherase
VLREATDVSDAEAERLLVGAGWQTKVALVAILAAVDVETSRGLLEDSRGYVRAAVEAARSGKSAP